MSLPFTLTEKATKEGVAEKPGSKWKRQGIQERGENIQEKVPGWQQRRGPRTTIGPREQSIQTGVGRWRALEGHKRNGCAWVPRKYSGWAFLCFIVIFLFLLFGLFKEMLKHLEEINEWFTENKWKINQLLTCRKVRSYKKVCTKKGYSILLGSIVTAN